MTTNLQVAILVQLCLFVAFVQLQLSRRPLGENSSKINNFHQLGRIKDTGSRIKETIACREPHFPGIISLKPWSSIRDTATTTTCPSPSPARTRLRMSASRIRCRPAAKPRRSSSSAFSSTCWPSPSSFRYFRLCWTTTRSTIQTPGSIHTW